MCAAKTGNSLNMGTRQLDVLIIGAGFGGCYGLYKLRRLGFIVHVFEAGSNLGGVWHWNSYPGARVDSEIPYYQFSMPEVWRKWNWSERFPSGDELKAYFKHVDESLGLSKDITYSANVTGATFDESVAKWTVTTENGHKAVCKYLICATGSSFKPHYPAFKNLHRFQGQLIHSTRWPSVANTKNTRVAIVGSGATAVQCTQEVAKEASLLTVYIRTASISLPMFQRPLSEFEQRVNKSTYRHMFAHCRQTKSGLGYDPQPGSVFELNDDAREELWEELWARGGFNFNQANYRDFLVNTKANKLMYEFWAKKTRPRLKNPEKSAFLVPEKAPFAFGRKRSTVLSEAGPGDSYRVPEARRGRQAGNLARSTTSARLCICKCRGRRVLLRFGMSDWSRRTGLVDHLPRNASLKVVLLLKIDHTNCEIYCLFLSAGVHTSMTHQELFCGFFVDCLCQYHVVQRFSSQLQCRVVYFSVFNHLSTLCHE